MGYRGSTAKRRLSATVQLSAPEDYDGGSLELRDGAAVRTATREAGSLVAFPSTTLHRVTPVTRGVRYALVAWYQEP